MAKELIQYTDGSARPNPGNAGWGIHGYYYDTEKPKKGSGHKTHILTSEGYKAKLDQGAKAKEVTPICYFDTVGSIASPATNNVAELKAAIEALKNTLKLEATKTTIFSDSKMVVEGSNGWIYNWKNHGWKKKDGSPISNLGMWQEIYNLKNTLKNKNVEVAFDWVMGHGDNPGNILADKLSVIGTMRSKRNEFIVQEDKSEADGYWKYDADKNPLLDHTALYFNTLTGYNQPGLYYLGNKYREDDMIGAPVADTAYSVVKLNTADPAIELVRNHQSNICENGKRDLLVLCRLDQLFNSDIHRDIMNYGEDCLTTKDKRWDLYHASTDEPVSRVLNPPKLAARAVEELSYLLVRLEQFENKDDSLVYNDITSEFFETVPGKKKGETTTKLKDTLTVGISSWNVTVKCMVGGQLKDCPLILTFGSDIIGRNALKRLEGHNPKVTIITWVESDLMIKYACVIETDEGISILASVYSNLRLLT